MFWKKSSKTADKSADKKRKIQAVKKPAADSARKKDASAGKEDASDRVLAKLAAIEKETRLKQVRDNVDQLDDEKIAEHLESLLKSLRNE
ncbi:MAG: hypothetical protein HFG88_14680 [Dorea sp.]|nr:hypothetical protein [Dorea sp.]